MKIRKDMIFAVLTTFCMCALMFTVIPIRSGLPYDPWADYDDNNKIDMKDIGNAAARFGTLNTDNLTRNVNVTNWPTEEPRPSYTVEERDFNTSFGSYMGAIWWQPFLKTAGYRQLFISITQLAWSYTTHSRTTVWLGRTGWVWSYYEGHTLEVGQDYLIYDTPLNHTSYAESGANWQSAQCNFTVKAKEFYPVFVVNSDIETGWVIVRVQLYLTN